MRRKAHFSWRKPNPQQYEQPTDTTQVVLKVDAQGSWTSL
jgi:hypothetical protein